MKKAPGFLLGSCLVRHLLERKGKERKLFHFETGRHVYLGFGGHCRRVPPQAITWTSGLTVLGTHRASQRKDLLGPLAAPMGKVGRGRVWGVQRGGKRERRGPISPGLLPSQKRWR